MSKEIKNADNCKMYCRKLTESKLITNCFVMVAGLVLLSCYQTACASKAQMQVRLDAESGQYRIFDGEQPVLQYNYAAVKLPEGYIEKVRADARIFAVERSNYIHPLFGFEGEELTLDWSVDHPHHRGIYWAWPEVQYHGKTADLHALQKVFARPTGNITIHNGNDYAEITAKNQWLWEDKTAIVLETVTIRAWPSDENGRYVDLTYTFAPLFDGVTLARRKTNAYGGLNIRMQPIKNMKLIHHADPAKTKRQVAWQAATGIWKDATKPLVLAVFEKLENPEYPGDYIEYPNLPWFQPTFPRTGTRFELKKEKPLVLRYRLWIASGEIPTAGQYRQQWEFYQNTK